MSDTYETKSRVLYIDDEEPARRAFRRVIRRKGFKVDIAGGADEAQRLAESNVYDVIVTDLQMPGEDGVALIGRLSPLQPEAAFLLVTGAEEMDIPQDAPEVQLISEIVFKPWHANELASALKRAVVGKNRRPNTGKAEPRSVGPILLIEHERTSASIIEEMISDGCRWVSGVLVADTLAQARDLMRSTSFSAAVVSLDLPDAPGVTAVTEIVSSYPNTPVVVLTAPGDELVLKRALEAGASHHFAKGDLRAGELSRTLEAAQNERVAREHLRQLANYDPLTGLPNRVHFREQLSRILRRATEDQITGLLFIDVDRFKDINDTLGHAVGDDLLRGVSERLKGALPSPDCAARLTGDQFVVVLPDIAGVEEVSRIARAFVQSMAKPLHLAERDLFVTASIGMAISPPSRPDVERLLKDAETAMHRAKQAGRNRYRVHLPEMDGQAAQRLTMESDLGLALERNQFQVYYQPLVEMGTGNVVGAEALLRWIHPERGLISPFSFIPPLEETGLIVQVGEWVLNEVCQQNKVWQTSACFPPLRVAVNIAAVQFQEEDMQDTVRKALEHSGLEPEYLALEITESALLEDSSTTRTSLQAIKEMGVSISLDDFGTGYSSLSYLKRYPIDTLKIDRSFVRDITTDPDDEAIALAIIALGKALRLEVVAEGIETQEHLDLLTTHGCDKYQGYFCAKPMPAEEFAAWLEERKEGAAGAA